MKSRIIIGLALVFLLMLTTCGKDNPASSNDDDPINPNVESKEIGPAGGNISSKDGLLTLTIPAGALSESQTITVEKIAVDDLGSEFENINVQEAYELGPDGLVFDVPVLVSFAEDQNPIVDSDSLEINSVSLLSSENGNVIFLDNLQTFLDSDEVKIMGTGEISHFSPIVKTKGALTLRVGGLRKEVEVSTNFFDVFVGGEVDLNKFNRDSVILAAQPESPLEVEEGASLQSLVLLSGVYIQNVRHRCPEVGKGRFIIGVAIASEPGQTGEFIEVKSDIECVPEALSTFTLTAELAGGGAGTVTSEPAGIDCPGDCTEDYTQGNDVILDANPAEGSEFVNWTGDIGANSPEDSVITLTMDQNRNVTAVFSEIPSFTLEVLKDGTGTGTVTSDPAGINYGDDNSEDYLDNTVVTLTATPDEGSVFSTWSGDIDSESNDPDSTTISLTMNMARTVTAVFDEEEPTGGFGVFPSGTGSPRGLITVPNPWGDLTFPTNCPNVWIVAGADVGVVDPCNGNVIAVLDIPFEVSSTGGNGGIALAPVIDNLLLLTSQSGWFSAKLVANQETGEIEIAEFSETKGGFIYAVGPNRLGGTEDALITTRLRIEKLSADLSQPGGYPDQGEFLAGVLDKDFNPGNMTGEPRQAYATFTDNVPGSVTGIGNYSNVLRFYHLKRESDGGLTEIIGPEAGEETNDFDCVNNPNQAIASNKLNSAKDSHDAAIVCVGAVRPLDGIKVAYVFNNETNPIQVQTYTSVITSPTAVAIRNVPGGVELMVVSFFGGEIYWAKFSYAGVKLAEAWGSYPSGVDGVEHGQFNPLDENSATVVGRNGNGTIATVKIPVY